MDISDKAKPLEQLERQCSIERQLDRAAIEDAIEPIYIDGVPCCRDCHDPLDEDRLRARPNAARCVPCKMIWEHRKNNNRRTR